MGKRGPKPQTRAELHWYRRYEEFYAEAPGRRYYIEEKGPHENLMKCSLKTGDGIRFTITSGPYEAFAAAIDAAHALEFQFENRIRRCRGGKTT